MTLEVLDAAESLAQHSTRKYCLVSIEQISLPALLPALPVADLLELTSVGDWNLDQQCRHL